MKKVLVAFGLFYAGLGQATTYTGIPQVVQSSASPTTAGNTRMSISTGSTTACTGSYPGWYSYDMPSASVGSAWSLTAVAAGKPVTITGSGTCDAYGLEIVTAISAYP